MANRFCALVGCRIPLQQAPMSAVATPKLAAAVTDAGGLGMIGVARQPLAASTTDIDAVRELTTGPVGAAFLVPFLTPAALAYAAERLPIVEFFWGEPDASVVPSGCICGWQVGSVDEAKAAVDAGCAYVIAQGHEAGGHVRGTALGVELVAAVRAAVDVPIVASGGIGTPDDARARLERGADAVRLGTRFIAAIESAAHLDYVDALIRATADDAILTDVFSVGWRDAPHRVLAMCVRAVQGPGPDPVATIALDDGTSIELPRRSPALPTTKTSGQIEAMALYAGTGVDAVTGRTDAAAIVAEFAPALASS